MMQPRELRQRYKVFTHAQCDFCEKETHRALLECFMGYLLCSDCILFASSGWYCVNSLTKIRISKMAFKEFTDYDIGKKTYAEKGVFVVRPTGHIFFPEKLLDRFDVVTPTHVSVSVDDDTREIAFSFGTFKTKEVVGIFRPIYREPSGYTMNFKPLLKHFNIALGTRLELKVEIELKNNVLIVKV